MSLLRHPKPEQQHGNVMLLLLRCFLRSLPAADEVGAVSVHRHFTVVTLEQSNSPSIYQNVCDSHFQTHKTTVNIK